MAQAPKEGLNYSDALVGSREVIGVDGYKIVGLGCNRTLQKPVIGFVGADIKSNRREPLQRPDLCINRYKSSVMTA